MIISTSRRHPHQGFWMAGGAAALAALGIWGAAALARLGVGGEPAAASATPARVPALSGPTVAAANGSSAWAGTHGDTTAPAPGPAPEWLSAAPQAAAPWSAQPFRADKQGQLVVDAGTLRTLEQVVAFSAADGVERAALQTAAGQRLPEPARQQAVELAQRFERYAEAQRLAVNPQHAPSSVDEMAAQFKALQGLRREQFGEAAAGRLFGDDEAVTARLIELMQADPEPQDTLEAKALRAQARLSAERAQGS